MGVKVREYDGGHGGKKAWWIFIDHQGKRQSKRVGTGVEGRKAAILLAEKLTAKIALEEFGISDKLRVTFSTFTETWLSNHVDRNLRLTTAAKYREVIRKHWLPRLGNIALADITRQMIRAHVQRMQRDFQNNTIRWFLNVLQSCLAAAMDEGRIDGNPATQSTRGLFRGSSGRTKEIDVFTKPEIIMLLKRAEARSPMTHAMVMTLARTGLRISEMLGIRTDDLDFERREIHIRRTWGNQSRGPEYFGIPKSGKSRIVDMSNQLKAVLIEQVNRVAVALNGNESRATWLFPSSHGRPMTPNSFYAVHWKPLFNQILSYRHPHTLRHTYATQLLWQGESPVYVKDQLGHASIRITVDLYGQHIRSWNKSAVDQLDDDSTSNRTPDACKEIGGLKIIKGGMA